MSVASRNCYNKLYPDLWEVSGKVRGQRGVYAFMVVIVILSKQEDDL